MKITERLKRIIRGITLNKLKRFELRNIDAIITDLEERREETKRMAYDKLVNLSEKIKRMTIARDKAKTTVVRLKNEVTAAISAGDEERAGFLASQYEIAKNQYEIANTSVEEGTNLHEKLLMAKKKQIERVGHEIELLRMKHAQAEMKREMVDMTGGFATDLSEDDLRSAFENVKALLDSEEIQIDAHLEVSQKFKPEEFDAEPEVDNSAALARFRAENNC